MLSLYFPQSNIIDWQIWEPKARTPINWDYQFDVAYGCSELKVWNLVIYSQISDVPKLEGYPCDDRKILIGFDTSGKLGKANYDVRIGFCDNKKIVIWGEKNVKN
jgi:hypothetical protein